MSTEQFLKKFNISNKDESQVQNIHQNQTKRSVIDVKLSWHLSNVDMTMFKNQSFRQFKKTKVTQNEGYFENDSSTASKGFVQLVELYFWKNSITARLFQHSQRYLLTKFEFLA